MNEKIDLCEILKDYPRGAKLWDDKFGEVTFSGIIGGDKPISVVIDDGVGAFYTKEGYRSPVKTECVLFPSKDCRDWSKWKHKKPKFDPKTLQPFDKVLVRVGNVHAYGWFADFVSAPAIEDAPFLCLMSNKDADIIIPYNEDTKHLVGTSDEAPEYYRYWED